MLEILRANERGRAEHGWLTSYHTFSFGGYYDPKHMGFGPLRVLNEDWVKPDRGFGTHGHRDMEIITYVLEGAVAHEDSMGNGSTIHPNDVQRMSAGTGVMHSEFNPSPDQVLHMLQIWIEPNVIGVRPSYEEKAFPQECKRGRLCLIASPDGQGDSVTIQQNATVYASILDGSAHVSHHLAPGRCAFVHIAQGVVRCNGERLETGDAAQITDTARIDFDQGMNAELLLFDLPGLSAPKQKLEAK